MKYLPNASNYFLGLLDAIDLIQSRLEAGEFCVEIPSCRFFDVTVRQRGLEISPGVAQLRTKARAQRTDSLLQLPAQLLRCRIRQLLQLGHDFAAGPRIARCKPGLKCFSPI